MDSRHPKKMQSHDISLKPSRQVLLFHAGEAGFAIPLTDIHIVTRMAEISPCEDLDEKPACRVGTLTYYERSLPVYSLHELCGYDLPEPRLDDRLIILGEGRDEIVLWVNRIDGICEEGHLTPLAPGSRPDDTKIEDLIQIIPGAALCERSSEIILFLMDYDVFIREACRGGMEGIRDTFPGHAVSDVTEPGEEVSRGEEILPGKASLPGAPGRPEGQVFDTGSSIDRISTALKGRSNQIGYPEEPSLEGQKIDILLFKLRYKEYAFEMKHIREVLINNRVTEIPGVPDYIKGVFALRGEIISLVDIGRFFSLPEAGLTDLNRVIIISDGELSFGILADYITDIRSIPESSLKDPDESALIPKEYIIGIGPDLLTILDARALLSDPDMIIDQD